MQPTENIYQYMQLELQKTLVPLFSVCHLSSEEQQILSLSIAEIVLSEILMRVIQLVPEDQKKTIVVALNSGGAMEEKFAPIHALAEASPTVVDEVNRYLTTDFPAFLSNLVETYLRNATEEQRAAFAQLVTTS